MARRASLSANKSAWAGCASSMAAAASSMWSSGRFKVAVVEGLLDKMCMVRFLCGWFG